MKVRDMFPGCTVFNEDEFIYVVTSYPRFATDRDKILPGYDASKPHEAYLDVTYSTGDRSTRAFKGMDFDFPDNIRIEKPDDPFV